jgi:hypothetical protein
MAKMSAGIPNPCGGNATSATAAEEQAMRSAGDGGRSAGDATLAMEAEAPAMRRWRWRLKRLRCDASDGGRSACDDGRSACDGLAEAQQTAVDHRRGLCEIQSNLFKL